MLGRICLHLSCGFGISNSKFPGSCQLSEISLKEHNKLNYENEKE